MRHSPARTTYPIEDGKGERMKNNKWIIPILSVVCVVSLGFMIVALCKTAPTNTKFVPPDFDRNAISGIPEVPGEYGWSEIYQDGMSFRVGISQKIILNADNQADVYLYNSESNDVWLKLRILDDDGEILSESGLIKSGEYVKTVTFAESVHNGQKVKMKIMSYQPETYYSEGSIILNTIIQSEG